MLRGFALSAVLLGLAVGQAQAQYQQPGYAQPPPPQDYQQQPGYGPPGYPPPGGGYPPPPREYGYGPPGSRCDAVFRTPYGPRRDVCPMGIAKPVGAPCACPSRDGYGPTAHGHVIP